MELKLFKGINTYLILAFGLMIFEMIYILKGHWSGDFFEHSAVVNELSKNVFSPTNPIIKSQVPHAFFSPYSVLVAIFSKITGLGAIHSLACFASFNLAFFLGGFYYFSKSVFKRNYISIASCGLVLTLIFWGKSPFVWSGFYHLFGLHYVLPYPSTFAIALSLFVLGMVSKNDKKYYWVIIVSSAVVFITHPTTAIVLCTGIVTWCFSFHQSSIKQFIIKSSVLIVPSMVLSVLWPYFNMVDLFIGNHTTADFHEQSFLMYTDVFKKNWPILLVIPSFIVSKKDKVVLFLALTIVLLLSVYVFGYFFNVYGVARVISGVMLFSHFLMAYTVVSLIGDGKFSSKIYLIFIFVAIISSISLNFGPLGKVVSTLFKKQDIEYYEQYAFLENVVKPNDIILSDSNSNWIIPSYNGKVIASGHPLYWVNDYEARRQAVDSFFMNTNKDSIREQIIQNYHPDYILINDKEVDFSRVTHEWLHSLGETVYKKDNIELIRIYQ